MNESLVGNIGIGMKPIAEEWCKKAFDRPNAQIRWSVDNNGHITIDGALVINKDFIKLRGDIPEKFTFEQVGSLVIATETSMKLPKIVNGNVNIQDCNITSLKGIENIKGVLYIENAPKLTDLGDVKNEVISISIRDCKKLTSLETLPKTKSLTLVNVPIKKLESLQSRMTNLSVVNTKIVNTDGLPQRIDGILEIRENKALKNITELPDVVMQRVYWEDNSVKNETAIKRIKCNNIKIR